VGRHGRDGGRHDGRRLGRLKINCIDLRLDDSLETVNAIGAVVGINTMIVGGDQGIAIPSHVAGAFVEQAVKDQHADWGNRS
jgi:hypothetical protein